MSKQIMEGVKPTRMQLLEIRKKLDLAEKGHKLLEEKRDALVEKFFSVIDQRNEIRDDIDKLFEQAFFALVQAQMTVGEKVLEDVSFLSPVISDLVVEYENIMGVKIPVLQKKKSNDERNPMYSFLQTSASVDDAFVYFNDVVNNLIVLSDVESRIKSLSVEIEKTKRRVNVLENTLIPKLNATIGFIEMQLEEREREDFFRRKRIKALMEKKKQ
ncbi:MAG: V-type ATP synthase subunit D [Thermoplasmatota archaeon]